MSITNTRTNEGEEKKKHLKTEMIFVPVCTAGLRLGVRPGVS
jgi:hypothetical protein